MADGKGNARDCECDRHRGPVVTVQAACPIDCDAASDHQRHRSGQRAQPLQPAKARDFSGKNKIDHAHYTSGLNAGLAPTIAVGLRNHLYFVQVDRGLVIGVWLRRYLWGLSLFREAIQQHQPPRVVASQ